MYNRVSCTCNKMFIYCHLIYKINFPKEEIKKEKKQTKKKKKNKQKYYQLCKKRTCTAAYVLKRS